MARLPITKKAKPKNATYIYDNTIHTFRKSGHFLVIECFVFLMWVRKPTFLAKVLRQTTQLNGLSWMKLKTGQMKRRRYSFVDRNSQNLQIDNSNNITLSLAYDKTPPTKTAVIRWHLIQFYLASMSTSFRPKNLTRVMKFLRLDNKHKTFNITHLPLLLLSWKLHSGRRKNVTDLRIVQLGSSAYTHEKQTERMLLSGGMYYNARATFELVFWWLISMVLIIIVARKTWNNMSKNRNFLLEFCSILVLMSKVVSCFVLLHHCQSAAMRHHQK